MSAHARRLVLFDLDGTLVDSAPDLAAATNAMLAELGLAPIADDDVRRLIGRGGRELVRRVLTGALGVAPDEASADVAYRSFADHYLATLDRATRLYPGVRAGLDALHEQGHALGCVTNKPARFTEPLLRALRLDAELEVIVCGDTLPVMKPDPAPLLHAAERCATAPAHCVMVGDTLTDIAAARAAGIRAVWVSYGYSHGLDVAAVAPDATLDTLADITRAL